MTAFDMAARK